MAKKDSEKKEAKKKESADDYLTPRRERFCKNIVLKGMTHREAYVCAGFSTKNMSQKSIDVEASKLLKIPKISLRCVELQKQLENKAVMDAEKRMQLLSRVASGDEWEMVVQTDLSGKTMMVDGEPVLIEEPVDIKTRLKAVDYLNKMDGQYTTKITGDLSVKKLEELFE